MDRNNKSLLPVIIFVLLTGLLVDVDTALGQAPGERPRPTLPSIPIKGDTAHTLTRYFTQTRDVKKKTPDTNGFIQRWLVLEPIRKDITRNNILTEKYLRTTFTTDNFSTDFTAVPKDGKKVKVGGQDLTWYALDSKTYNFNLYHFTYAINKAPYGVLFWLVTVINCPEEISNVRMAAGVNSGGMFG